MSGTLELEQNGERMKQKIHEKQEKERELESWFLCFLKCLTDLAVLVSLTFI